MPPELIPLDEEYASEEDSDFAPDAVPVQEDAESSDEESDADGGDSTAKSKTKGKGKPKSIKRKRTGGDGEEAEDAGFENSGDEAIIEKGLKRQKKKGKKGHIEEDEGGEGGLIKTRSMRAQEKVEKKPLVDTSAATIDVNSLWAAMISGKPAPAPEPIPPTENNSAILSPSKGSLSPNTARAQPRKDTRSPSTTLSDGPDSMIMMKRTYNFAGKVVTEQKLVARNSAEAKLYLATQPDPSTTATETPAPDPSDPFTKPKRPPKKARRSIFEPITDGLPQRTDLHFEIRKDSNGVALVGVTGKEKKLNTVEKSAMDWAGFVDKEGIADELDAAGKSKGAYKARQEFLARIEDRREEEARRARGL